MADDVINSAHSVVVDVMRRAQREEGRSLLECTNGFWVNLASGDEAAAYPWFMVRSSIGVVSVFLDTLWIRIRLDYIGWCFSSFFDIFFVIIVFHLSGP